MATLFGEGLLALFYAAGYFGLGDLAAACAMLLQMFRFFVWALSLPRRLNPYLAPRHNNKTKSNACGFIKEPSFSTSILQFWDEKIQKRYTKIVPAHWNEGMATLCLKTELCHDASGANLKLLGNWKGNWPTTLYFIVCNMCLIYSVYIS